MKLWISGYGGRSGETAMPSIYLYDTAATPAICWQSTISSPSYLDIDGERLLALCEEDKQGAVSLFCQREGKWVCTDTRVIHGNLFCHIRYFAKHGVVAGACYGTGHVFTLEVKGDHFGELKSWLRQSDAEVSRAHCILANRDETRAYVANIALDRLYYYDLVDGVLRNERFLQLPLGEGIRHLLIREDMGRIFATTEYANQILTIDISGTEPQLVDSISSLQPNFAGISYLSGLCMTADGTKLFAANRGADTIAVFSVENGRLTKTGEYDCYGKWPREIALVDDEKAIAIANQKSNAVVIFPLNADGSFGEVQHVIPFLEPSFVRQAEV